MDTIFAVVVTVVALAVVVWLAVRRKPEPTQSLDSSLVDVDRETVHLACSRCGKALIKDVEQRKRDSLGAHISATASVESSIIINGVAVCPYCGKPLKL